MWKAIETADKSKFLDLFAGGSRYFDCRWNADRSRWEHWWPNEFESWDWCEVPNPTHWMPVPKPPVQIGTREYREAEENETSPN